MLFLFFVRLLVAARPLQSHIRHMDSTEAGKAETVTGKVRSCLKCQTPFLSAWEGHRVCDRCKHTSAWREGVPAQTYRADGRR